MSHQITAEYSREGYAVLDNGQEIYTAGNHRMDSQGHAPLSSSFAVTLRELRRFAVSTAREMAKERGAKFGGVERVKDNE